ncbi:phage portal protein [Mycobacterium sp. SMC-2]|uniref:phage portal protein n=1 Tax=Mycobacterium sp. SMC-2 TaxID=2857058 RepID=UPI0021B332ED|nr:phage portal protein [Mycobacterium sp. SMC-2]UXA08677.1 phage portal protein [Mycobacterium sp. SMC-2]
MSTPDALVNLLMTLDAPQGRFAELSRYYEGYQPLSFLSPESLKCLGNRFARMNVNICRLAIQSQIERLRVCGFEGDDRVWDWWVQNELDLESEMAHREACLYGASYALIWTPTGGSPVVTIESARQVAVHADPHTRQITEAVKRYYTDGQTHAWWYLPDVIRHYQANTVSAANTALELVAELPNPLAVVPVVQLRNSSRIPVSHVAYPDRLLEYGTSDLQDVLPLVDALSKTLADMMISSEFTARPRRWATGVELVETPRVDDNGNPVLDTNGEQIVDTENPFPEGDKMMISEEAAAKFGQLEGSDLSGYENAVKVIMSAIQAVTCLPASYLGILSDQPNSADALRAASAGLTARAESKQKSFGKGWTRVAQLMVAANDGADPNSVNVSTKWSPADYRSMAEESDAALKLYSGGILSRETTLARLGFSESEIAVEIERLNADHTAADNTRFNRYLEQMQTQG